MCDPLTGLSDEELLRRALGPHPEARACAQALYTRLYPILVRHLLHLDSSLEDAQEVCQELFCKLFAGKMNEVTQKSSIKALLIKAARNRYFSLRLSSSRRSARHERAQLLEPARSEDDILNAEEAWHREAQRALVRDGIHRLSTERDRTLLTTLLSTDNSQDLAKLINVPVERVKVIKARAIKRLQLTLMLCGVDLLGQVPPNEDLP